MSAICHSLIPAAPAAHLMSWFLAVIDHPSLKNVAVKYALMYYNFITQQHSCARSIANLAKALHLPRGAISFYETQSPTPDGFWGHYGQNWILAKIKRPQTACISHL